MSEKFYVDVSFNPQHAFSFLVDFGLLRPCSETQKYSILSVEDAIDVLPMFKRAPVLHQADLLDIKRRVAKENLIDDIQVTEEESFSWH